MFTPIKAFDFQRCLEFVLRWEGGYSCHDLDPGGATNKGITQSTYTEWCKTQNKPIALVKDITDKEVEEIYYNNYWLPSQGDLTSWPLNLAMFDYSVNAGVTRMMKSLQNVLLLDIDGICGKKTIKALEGCDATNTARNLCDDRYKFYIRIVQNKPELTVFLNGWINRLEDLRKVAGV